MYLLIKDITTISQTEIDYAYKKLKRERQEKIEKLKTINAKKRSMVGEMLLIKGLKDFYNIDYEKITISYNLYGKPYLLNKNIYYNISHSNHMVVCVFSNKEIGIDIENIRHTNINTTSIFATDAEKEYIKKDNTDIEKKLFQIYTLKEAYFKMKGKDLSNMKEVEFIIKKDIDCNDKSVNAKLIDKEDYIIAICEKN